MLKERLEWAARLFTALVLTAAAAAAVQVGDAESVDWAHVARRLLATDHGEGEVANLRATLERERGRLEMEARGAANDARARGLYGIGIQLAEAGPDSTPAGCSAEVGFEVALEAARYFGQPEREAYVHWRFAIGLVDANELVRADEVLTAGWERLGEAAPGVAPWLLVERAALARRNERYGEARELAFEALARVDPVAGASFNHDVLPATVRGELGRVEQKLGNFDSAVRHFREEARLAQESGNVAALASAALHGVRLASALGDHRYVLELAGAALEGGAEFPGRAVAELRLLHARARLGLAPEAEVLDAVREVRAALASEQLAAGLRHGELAHLAERLKAVGEFEQAAEHLAEAEALVAASEGKLPADDFAVECAYLTMARTLLTIDTLGAAARTPEGRAALEPLVAESRRAFEAVLEAWERTPVTSTGVGFGYFGRRSRTVSGWLQLLLLVDEEGRGAELALEALVRVQAMGSLARGQGLEPGDLAALRERLLAPGEGLLVYHLAVGGSFLFVLDHNTLQAIELPDLADLRAARSELLSVLSGPPSTGPEGAVLEVERERAHVRARALGAALVPVGIRERLAGWDALTLVQGGSILGWIPFEALGLDDGRYLGDLLPIRHLPSVAIGLELAERGAMEPVDELLFWGLPDDSLPFGATQRGALEELFGAELELATGPRATAERLAQAAGSSDALLILSHGEYDPQAAHPARLRAAGGGVLDHETIAALAAPPVVILLACRVEDAPLRVGEDVGPLLSGAWLQAGARGLLVSSAELDFAASWELGVEVLAGLRAGRDLAEAAWRARRVVGARAPFAHPYYTQLLRVVGGR